jgi:lipopolysaccharide export system permease protein
MGIPIGVNVRKSVKARGLTISIIIVLLYYVTQLFGSAITQTGKVSPWAGMWFPTIVFTITGIFLFVRAAREDKMEISGNIIFLTNLVKRILRQP